MVALQVRDVPDEVHEALVAQAHARGIPLQGLLLEMLTVEARRARNLAILQRSAERAAGTSVTNEDVDDALARARAERDEALQRP